MIRRIIAVLALLLGLFGAWACENAPQQVVITQGLASPREVHLSRKAGDRLVWKNSDASAHVVSFAVSPFGNGEQRIDVPAGGASRIFTVNRAAATGDHPYDIHSPAQPDSNPNPIVIVDE